MARKKTIGHSKKTNHAYTKHNKLDRRQTNTSKVKRPSAPTVSITRKRTSATTALWVRLCKTSAPGFAPPAPALHKHCIYTKQKLRRPPISWHMSPGQRQSDHRSQPPAKRAKATTQRTFVKRTRNRLPKKASLDVEPVFANMKNNHNSRRFMLRDKEKVETDLLTLAHNLRKNAT